MRGLCYALLPFLVAYLASDPIVTRASTWRLVTVAQPAFGDGCISFRDVIYGDGSLVPGTEVAATCQLVAGTAGWQGRR